MYWVHQIHSNDCEVDRSAIAIRMRSRQAARAEEFARWVAEGKEPRDGRGAQPRSAVSRAPRDGSGEPSFVRM